MKTIKLLALILLSLLSVAVYAKNAPKEMVSEDAKWVIYLDVKQLRGTELWKMIKEKSAEKAEGPSIQQYFDQFKKKFNLDPEKDVNSILLYGKEAGNEKGVIIVRGHFDEAWLVKLVENKEGYETSKMDACTIHQWIDEEKTRRSGGKEKTIFCTFYNKETLVLSGNKDDLKKALNVLDGKAGSLADSKTFSSLDVDKNAFFSIIADTEKARMNKAQSGISKKLKKGSLFISENNGELTGKLVALMENAQAATNANTFIQGMIALVKMDENTDPDLAEALKNIKIDCKDNLLTVDLKFKVAKLKAFIEKKAAQSKQEKASDAEKKI